MNEENNGNETKQNKEQQKKNILVFFRNKKIPKSHMYPQTIVFAVANIQNTGK